MKIFVPINNKIDNLKYVKVKMSILSQTDVTPLTIEEVYFPFPEDNSLKWKPLAKQHCKQLMLACEENYVVINDNEYENLYSDNYVEMKEFLDNNSQFGAVSLRSHISPTLKSFHVCAGIIMFRREALKVTEFDLTPKLSSCISIMRSLFANKWKYDYLEIEPRCEKL